MRFAPLPLVVLAAALLSGCIARTAADIVTFPVKAGSKAVDLATTSEEEKDEKFVRRMRRDCEAWQEAHEDAQKARRRDPSVPLPAPPNAYCEER